MTPARTAPFQHELALRTDADRNLANQLAEHTEPEWLDAPLAAWKNDAHARPRRAPFTHN
jgi:hypothetical protein